MFKKIFQILILAVLVLASFAGAGKAEAWSGCGSSYYVQWGDTLFKIAAKCGTTMEAIRQANPGLYNWVYAGQTLRMPGWDGTSYNYQGSQGSFTYVVAAGDTLKIIAARYGTTWDAIARLNALYNPNVIYPGQVLQIPSQGYYPPSYHDRHDRYESTKAVYWVARKGDTLLKIANWNATTVSDLHALNPQLPKSDLIKPGDVIRVK